MNSSVERSPLATSLLKAIDILEALRDDPDVPLADVAARVGMGKATVHRVLNTLCTRGYVERVGKEGRYRLGIRAFELGTNAIAKRDIRIAAMDSMQELLAVTGELVHLAIPTDAGVVVIDRLEPDHPIQLRTPVGLRMPFETTALGRAYLAVAQQPSNTAADAELAVQLARAKLLGYAVDDGTYSPECRCASSAIRDHCGNVVGMIGIAAPAYRMPLDRLAAEVGPAVVAAARNVSEKMGGERFLVQHS